MANNENNDVEKTVSVLLSKMTMFDDTYMSVCFDNNKKLATLVLKIILGRNDIEVIDVKSQYTIANINNKDCRLDVKMRDSEGKLYDVEIQNKNAGARPRRARFYSSILDAKVLGKGQNIKKLVDTYIIFITKNDYYKKGQALYKIDRQIIYDDGVCENFEDGSHIIYVNGSYKGNNDIGHLMMDFNENDVSKMYFDEMKNISNELRNDDRKIKD